jgi:(1->4)-alpha-D-glucan 1-alpha-D-glucosylmutase
VSTYRLQVYSAFTLRDAARVIPYLQRLGITTCYTAPYFTAAPGSTHGYDVWNHNEINPELGGDDAHREFCDTVDRSGMKHIVDFVPNHMGIGAGGNAWWTDVLENGPSSMAAGFFDIDWAPLKAELQAKLLLPILGDQYGRVLDRGELRLQFRDGALVLHYFDQELPINPRRAPRVLRLAVEPLTRELGGDSPRQHEFMSILSSLENLPAYTEREPERIAERHREKEVAKARLDRLVQDETAVARYINEAVERVNGVPGDAASFDLLHDLLEAQAYRLSYWRTASHEINYRRFFDVNTLAGLQVERQEVFDATHKLLGQLLADERVHGVRVDHPDGLFDPSRYFEMLQELYKGGGTRDTAGAQLPAAAGPRPPLYVVAEKILSGRERLPTHWLVHGTTGYNFLNDVNGLFVDTSQARRLRRAYAKLTGHVAPFADVLYESKRLIMNTAMASELNVLGHILNRIGESNRKSRDFTLDSLRDVITEVVACFPVYRTYVDARGWTPEDRAVIELAISEARRRNPAMESSLFDFFREVVLPRDPSDSPGAGAVERRDGYPPADTAEANERLRFTMKLQQYTGPVQAKGLEDTAVYRYNVLISLNEVGGDPSCIGRIPQDFHDANQHRAMVWPYEMLATATHDTKLGEDVRARINVLSEIPEEWAREVSRWMRINRVHRSIVDGGPSPDRVDEYRLYQVLIGTWPPDAGSAGPQVPGSSGPTADLGTSGSSDAGTLGPSDLRTYVDRIREYMTKAVREAKVHSSWLTTNPAYEEGLTRFVERSLAAPGGRFLTAFLPFQRRVAAIAVTNSLAQLVLKIGSPGVPDFYQGTELWDLSLVDPDNRRPVDFEQRDRLLNEVDAAGAPGIESMLSHWQDGRIKLYVTTTGLRARRELADVFVGGDYVPLTTEVTLPAGIVAFARLSGDDAVIVVAPRLSARLVRADAPVPLGGDCWKTSRVLLPDSLRDRTYRNVFTGDEVRVAMSGDRGWLFVGGLFDKLPVAILRAV